MKTNAKRKNRFFVPLHHVFCYLICTLFCITSYGAAPVNDNCTNARVITIDKSGYGLGKFTSDNVDITNATIQTGETFAPAILVAGQNKKSIWFKFTIPTTRSVRVNLKLPSNNIEPGDVGFTVYKTSKCLPGSADISTKLTPKAIFGDTYHPCVEPGEYYVQVSAKNSANNEVFIELQISDETGAVYDHPKDAQEFGKLASPSNTAVDFDIECQSLEDAAEVCTVNGKKQPYTRSTWHTFTTPAYFDYLAVALAKHNSNTGRDVVGFNLYKGDVKKIGISGLILKDGCDSLVLNQYYIGYKTYTCNQLERNTTYTLQLFYKEGFNEKVRLGIELAGSAATNGPEGILSKIATVNKLGKLKSSGSGEYTYANDRLACNSRHSEHPCAYTQPSGGVVINSKNYNLSTFFTFSLSSMSEVRLDVTSSSCSPQYIFRLYQKAATATCTDLNKSNMVREFTSGSELDCLPAGDYTLQVLGRDTVNTYQHYSYGYLGSNQILCLRQDLGRAFQLQLRVKTNRETNLFSLANKNAVDRINATGGVMKSLKNGETYKASADTFGCENTVLPDKDLCKSQWNNQSLPITKAMYREFVIGDSGIVALDNQNYMLGYRLFKGEADALATAQNKFKYPEKISGLSAHTDCLPGAECQGRQVCVVPGTYTYVTFGNESDVGRMDQPSFKFSQLETMHNSPAKAQNMGSLLDSLKPGYNYVVSDIDRFSCRDNAITIGGQEPCTINGKKATKAIYRQFYLSKASFISINSEHYNECGYSRGGYKTLFYGKATDGVSGLKPVGGQWTCFQNAGSKDQCNTLPAGWYTVVSYGVGPSYEQPMRDVNVGGYGSYVDETDVFAITIGKACETPEYNRPHKAAVDSVTKKPFQIKWGNRVGSTAAYPRTDTTYTLYTEHFDCTTDASFFYAKACNNTVNRIAYYVFQTTQEAYVNINTRNYWGAVYALDVRKDSVAMKTATPIQPCIQSDAQIELCKLQPGTYTLVIFAGDNNLCSNVAPIIYIDQVGYSRFDHAKNAYDFDVIPADSAWHKGKVGDVNPLNKDRAPSNDFFYCTTGAQEKDPSEIACNVRYTPEIYKNGNNIHYYDENNNPQSQWSIPRRNLWYTFVVDKGGWVHIKVKNKTPGKGYQYPFAIYRSNVDGSLPFSEVVSKGEVDSTIVKGLTHIQNNNRWWYYPCDGTEEVKFYRDPCNNTPERYYIIVENRNPYYQADRMIMNPNSQVEVEILFDSVNSVQPKFDHYSQAYDFGKVGGGKYKGATDNYSCATADATDPFYYYKNDCARKTLWYKFTSTVTGHVRLRIRTNNKDYKYDYRSFQLFRQVIQGDSTSKGLSFEQYTSYPYSDGSTWAQTCISKGTYYLVLTGCDQVNEDVYPEIEIIEQAGDYCSAPLTAKINGAGNSEAKVIVDCHTIGTDYGEFGPTLTCPAGIETAKYKSSWFRIDIGGTQVLDVTAYIVENTIASSSEIKYRMMTGDCGAMQEQSCVEDALTQNTYECLKPGRSYYIQVLTPLLKNGQPVTGDINLKLSAKVHTAECSPPPDCLANANFQTQFDCTKDSAMKFVNFSTYGSSIKYTWEFGDGKTSNEVSPAHMYPALATSKTYKVKLTVENTSCGKKDVAESSVTIPGRPYVNLGEDIYLCNKDTTVTLRATSHKDATYYWWPTGSTDSVAKITQPGAHEYRVTVSYNNCVSNDTIKVYINPLEKNATRYYVLCAESLQLSAYRGQGEKYRWSTGEESYYITVKQPGTYWAELNWNGCVIRDSFVVTTAEDAHPLGNDTTLCFSADGYTLNGAVDGASSYRWQDGSSGATHKITKGGTYWVDITVANCTMRDSIIVSEAVPPKVAITGNLKFCADDSTLLNAGSGFASYQWSTGATTQTIYVKTAGNYSVTVTEEGGCAATAPAVKVVQHATPALTISGNRPLCDQDALKLDAGSGFASYLWNTGETTAFITTQNPGKYKVTVVDNNGCSKEDSVTVITSPPATKVTNAVALCQGQTHVMPSGRILNSSGTYTDTLRNVSGCDSLITTVKLTVHAVTTTAISATICTGQNYKLPSGRVVSATGNYEETLKAASGCDSIVITRLQVQEVLRSTVAATICFGQSYTLPSGRKVSAGGSYLDTIQTTAGCDSVITTQLAIHKEIVSSIAAAICQGQTYQLPLGGKVSQAGVYRDTLQAAAGCDSIVVTTLAVKQVVRENKSAAICSGQPYTLPSGKLVYTAGSYSDTLRYASGCDSLITSLKLTVAEVSRKEINAAICANQTYTLPSGKLVSKESIYKDTLTNAAGCDSIITTTLTVNPIVKTNLSVAICNGQSYTLPSGRVVSASGVYKETLQTTSGCDSIVTTTLTVNQEIRAQQTVTICQGQRFTRPSGAVVNTPGLYTDVLKAAGGCDSIVVTQLIVETVKTEHKTARICEGSTYRLPSGEEVSRAGTFKDTLRSQAGCDSLITTVDLSVEAKTITTATASICEGQAYQLPAGAWVHRTGVYKDTLRTVMGCDSIITTTTLTVRPRPLGIHVSNSQICVGGQVQLSAYGGDSYQWLPAGGVSLPGVASVWVQPDVTTTYRVVVNNVSCGALDTVSTTVTVHPRPVVNITKSNDINCNIGIAKLQATGGVKYSWTPAATLDKANVQNPIATPAANTVYQVQVTSDKGCVSTASIAVKVEGGEARYDVPSAFTPNGDGKNDCFGVKSWGVVTNLKFYVFSRWGELMFYTTDPNQCWDGTYKGKKLETATFVYQVTATTNCGDVYRKGTVILIR